MWQNPDEAEDTRFGHLNERDAESGLDPAEARLYSSRLGRWMTPDPENAGAEASDPQSWNAYAYAGNNPTTNTDPSGLSYCKQNSDGTLDLSSCISDKDYKSLGTNIPGYLHVSQDTSVTVNGSEATPEDYQAALVVGVQRAAPAVNATYEGLKAFGYLVNAPLTVAVECIAGDPDCTKGNVAMALLPEIEALREGATLLKEGAAVGKGAEILQKGGGIAQAESDFKSLAGHEEIRGPIRYKDLPNGQGRAVLRSDPSTWGDHAGPTLEIQPPGGGYARIKIRY